MSQHVHATSLYIALNNDKGAFTNDVIFWGGQQIVFLIETKKEKGAKKKAQKKMTSFVNAP